jgi:hypothetical protein
MNNHRRRRKERKERNGRKKESGEKEGNEDGKIKEKETRKC